MFLWRERLKFAKMRLVVMIGTRKILVGQNSTRGFTLLELLIVLGILAILIAAVVVAINPGRQFANARNAQRRANVQAMVGALYQNLIDNRGTFVCAAGSVPTSVKTIKTGQDGYDLCSCIVPTYLPILLVDPSSGVGKDCASYDTGYTIVKNIVGGRVTIAAPSAELGETISVTY